MDCLGIDIGLISVKVTLLSDGQERFTEVVDHEGNIPSALLGILRRRAVPSGLLTVVTGNAGRRHLRVTQAIPPQAVEAGLHAVDERPDAVVSLGGESIVVYTLGEGGQILEAIAGDKCAAGTGEFFRQQLGRMDLTLDVLDEIHDETRVHPLSSRCSVFMKSDCTHKLNKREASKHEIVVSLADVMAGKVAEFLMRARVERGRVLLIGGVTRNRFLRRFLGRRLPGIEFVCPPHGATFEAFGAAQLAARYGTSLPSPDALFEEGAVSFERYPSLGEAASWVERVPSQRGAIVAGRTYLLGIDGGSTTTKAVLVDAETLQIAAAHYGRTHGDPVEALRRVLQELRAQVQAALGEGARVDIPLCATTGSSREILGVFAETAGIYNEIVAHTCGTTHFQPETDTLFEIGGQDAKYVHIRNGVPIDYAMNEACSAGTGSFLEESAQGDLCIRRAEEIGPLALRSDGPLRFGEHCSAFINSDIRKAIQEGADKADIMAGIVFSIVSNYLNRVVGNRTIGQRIVLQGGVAKNEAVPLAFAAVLGRPILVPPDPELLGAYGVALLARQRHAEGELPAGRFDLDELIGRAIEPGKVFTCKTCDNRCPIRILYVGQARSRYYFGGRCNQYANLRRRRSQVIDPQADLVEVRRHLMFEAYAPDPTTLRPRTTAVVGIPKAFSVHSLWPLYSWYFHQLGVRVRLAEASLREGVQRAESAFCLPGELAHGMTEELRRAGVDYYFLPHLQNMQSMEEGTPATLCPLTQGLPYYLRPAFDLPDERILRPVLNFERDYESGGAAFAQMAERLGFTAEEGLRAFQVGLRMQRAFWERLRQIGTQVLSEAHASGELVIALFGRPYNAFAPEANMGIPRKLKSRGCRVLPFDFFPVEGEDMTENMYWYYGQLNMKAARLVRQHPNVYLCYISNFGCAPDSFMLHFVRWFMGTKPYLVLELDSHTADAGVDTRIEAFLDIIRGYRQKAAGLRERPYQRRYSVHLAGEKTRILDGKTGEELRLTDPRVRVIWPSMGHYSTQAITAISGQHGLRSEYLPTADQRTIHLARQVASGKECIPTLIVLGQILRLLSESPPGPDEVLAVIVPKTTGPCRTGQYAPFYERTFWELGLEQVAILNLCSDNGYQELGPMFSKLGWYALVLGDYFKDMELALRILAEDPASALRTFAEVWAGVVQVLREDITRLYPHLAEEAVPRLLALPRRGSIEALPRVIVVGEIYVRRDDHSVSELIDHLVANGIFPKVTGVTEWIAYCDYSREKILGKALAAHPWFRRPARPQFAPWLGFKVEQAFMRAIEERVAGILAPTGLVPRFPHDMREIMAEVDRFTHLDFETEATVSSLTASLAVRQGYDGIIAIAPFACLPGRLIKALLEPYCRREQVPFMAVEADGLRFPPNVVSRLEIFMWNVLRRGASPEAGDGFSPLRAPEGAAQAPASPEARERPCAVVD